MSKLKISALIAIPLASIAILSGCATQPYKESTGQYIDSSVITAKVKSKLLADDSIKALPITVKTYKSVVQLSGFVNNHYQREQAAKDARSVEGVTQVQNLLVLKPR